MNYKILIEVNVPMLEAAYDVFIPINRTVADITFYLAEAIRDITEGSFVIKPSLFLYDSKTGKIYDGKAVIKDSGIQNGTKVILN